MTENPVNGSHVYSQSPYNHRLKWEDKSDEIYKHAFLAGHHRALVTPHRCEGVGDFFFLLKVVIKPKHFFYLKRSCKPSFFNMLYSPALCNHFAQSSPDPPLLGCPIGAPGSFYGGTQWSTERTQEEEVPLHCTKQVSITLFFFFFLTNSIYNHFNLKLKLSRGSCFSP